MQNVYPLSISSLLKGRKSWNGNQKTAQNAVSGQQRLRVPFVTEQASFFLRTLGQVFRSAFRRSYPTLASTFIGGGLSTQALQLLEPSENSKAYHTALGLFRHTAVNLDYNCTLESRQIKNHALRAVFADSVKHGKGIGIPKTSISESLNLSPLVRVFESVVKQAGPDDKDDSSNDYQNINTVHIRYGLFLIRFNGNYGEKNTQKPHHDVGNYQRFLKSVTNHICCWLSFDKYTAAYKQKTVISMPKTDVNIFRPAAVETGKTCWITTPRKRPLAISLKKSASIENWFCDNCMFVQSKHKYDLMFCQ